MDWGAIFEGLGNLASNAMKTAQFQALLKLDRDAARQHLSRLIETLETEKLDKFENDFVSFFKLLYDPEQRIRAMELYAWLKVAETLHYQEFRGYSTSGRPIL